MCASARTELKRQLFLDIGVTDLCGKMVLEFGKLCRLYFFCLSVYIIEHKTLRGRRAELQAAAAGITCRAPVHCRLGTRAFFAPKCGKITVLCALLVWMLGPREAENGPKLSSTMYHLYVITVQYACSSRPSITCRHETWMIRAPKCSPMIVLCALLVWRLGLREADDGPTLSSTMYHLYDITQFYSHASTWDMGVMGTKI